MKALSLTLVSITFGMGATFAACGGDDATAPKGNDAAVEGAADAANDVAAETTSDVPVDSPPLDGGSPAAFCDATYGYARTAFESCCTAADKTMQGFQFVDALLGLGQQTCGTQLAASLGKGRISFDASSAQACISGFQQYVGSKLCWDKLVKNQSGKSTFNQAPCNAVVSGLQAQGAACAADYECKDGLTCVGWTTTSDGACQPPPAVGQPCEGAPTDGGGYVYLDYGFGSHPSCASGAYCTSDAGGQCAAQGASGASCFKDEECQSALECHLGQCGTAGPSPQGGSCNYKDDCQDGLYCETGDGGATGTCQPREASGGSCTEFGDQCKGVCAVPDASASGQCAAICGSG